MVSSNVKGLLEGGLSCSCQILREVADNVIIYIVIDITKQKVPTYSYIKNDFLLYLVQFLKKSKFVI